MKIEKKNNIKDSSLQVITLREIEIGRERERDIQRDSQDKERDGEMVRTKKEREREMVRIKKEIERGREGEKERLRER